VTDPRTVPPAPEDATRARLIDLKRRLTDLKLEALRRGYGLGTEDDGTIDDITDIDGIVAEVSRNVEERRRDRSRKEAHPDPAQWPTIDDHTKSSRV
jgi:hypothetical protein